MKKLVILILICFGSNAFSQECYLQDWEALKGLYLSTNGDNWTDTTGWTYIKNATGPNVDCPPSNLKGISLTISDYFDIAGRGIVIIKSVADIILNGNNLTNNLDSTIGNFPYLQNLYLSENYLDGYIPKEIGSLSSLVNLDLRSNNLTGEVPNELSNLNITGLYLSSNELSGNPLPYLPNSDYLRDVVLDHNQFEGSVQAISRPNAFYEYIDLSNTNFYGTLPRSIAHDQYIFDLDFSNTKISGCLDTAFYKLCPVFAPASHSKITNNNDIITSWSDFCNQLKGVCFPCQMNLGLSSPSEDFNRGIATYKTPADRHIRASNKITGNVNLTFDAGSVILEPGFFADTGTVFETKYGGCGLP